MQSQEKAPIFDSSVALDALAEARRKDFEAAHPGVAHEIEAHRLDEEEARREFNEFGRVPYADQEAQLIAKDAAEAVQKKQERHDPLI
jgi:hypothetical protein